MSALENGKTTMQKYKRRYLYIFKMADKTESSNRSSSKAHNRSYDRMNLKYVLLQ